MIMVSFINRLKQECLTQYKQFELRNKEEDKLFFFCFPKFDEKLDNILNFPDPWKYLFGFFLTPQGKGSLTMSIDSTSELEVPLSQSASSYK